MAPTWTSEAQAWYERWLDRLIEELKRYMLKGFDDKLTDHRAFSDEDLGGMRHWYRLRPERFVEWIEPLDRELTPGESYDTYHHDDWYRPRPHWRVLFDKMIAERGEAARAVRASTREQEHEERVRAGLEREASRYPTLDEWLARGAGKAPQYWTPAERRNRELPEKAFPIEARMRLQMQLQRLRRYCRSCGARLKSKPRNTVRCERCRDGAMQEVTA